MTRQIKFRAWVEGGGRWRQGIWQWEEIIESIDLECGWRKSVFSIGTDHESTIHLMQFTGLRDKNGKEIYESDIVRHDYATGEEFASNGIMVVGDETPDGYKIVGFEMFDPKCSTTYSFDANKEIQEDIEIIGNIYENPDLLTQ